jgi:hypothetical protein
MAGSHNPDDLTPFVLRIPAPLKNIVTVYAKQRHLSVNRTMRELLETHPAITMLYRSLTREDEE